MNCQCEERKVTYSNTYAPSSSSGTTFLATYVGITGGSWYPFSVHSDVRKHSQQNICWYNAQQDWGLVNSKSPDKHTTQLLECGIGFRQKPLPSMQKQVRPLHRAPMHSEVNSVQVNEMQPHLIATRWKFLVGLNERNRRCHKKRCGTHL